MYFNRQDLGALCGLDSSIQTGICMFWSSLMGPNLNDVHPNFAGLFIVLGLDLVELRGPKGSIRSCFDPLFPLIILEDLALDLDTS